MAMEVREATPADLPGITKVVLSAMTPECQWQYCFPYRNRYADDHATHTKAALEHCLNNPDDGWLVAVVEVPDRVNEQAKAIASVTIIGTPLPTSNPKQADANPLKTLVADGLHSRQDAKPARLNALVEAVASGREKYLAAHACSQMAIHLLATHPDYQKWGCARALCTWVLRQAKEKEMTVSAVVGPRGYVFYSGLGFTDVGHVVVNVEGEWEDLVLKTMAVVFKKEERRPSLMRIFSGDF